MSTPAITLVQLLIGLLLLMIPLYILHYYRTGLVKDMCIAVLRMLVQLFMVGFYLNYLFEWNNRWINIAWMLAMTGVCASDMIRRIHLSWKVMFIPLYASVFMAMFSVLLYFIKPVLWMEDLFDSRIFIPICGILLGNILSSNVIGINAFYTRVVREQAMYHYLLGNGATLQEALRPFISQALVRAFNPAIASMAAIGLVALPGTLVGQIIGGSSPALSIRYQIIIMIINITASMLSVLFALRFSIRHTFDQYGRLKSGVILE